MYYKIITSELSACAVATCKRWGSSFPFQFEMSRKILFTSGRNYLLSFFFLPTHLHSLGFFLKRRQMNRIVLAQGLGEGGGPGVMQLLPTELRNNKLSPSYLPLGFVIWTGHPLWAAAKQQTRYKCQQGNTGNTLTGPAREAGLHTKGLTPQLADVQQVLPLHVMLGICLNASWKGGFL